MVEKLKFKTKNDPFYLAIRKAVDEGFALRQQDRFPNLLFWFKNLIFLFMTCLSYGLLLFSGAEPMVLFGFALIYGVSSLLLALNIGHDCAHFCAFKKRSHNQIAHYISFAFLGVSAYLWEMRHNKSHHVFPNVNGCDIDIDENPFIRLSPNHPLKWYQKLQYIYAPFLYCIVTLHTVYYQDLLYLFKKSLANMQDIRHPKYEYILFILLKVVYIVMVFVLPLMLTDLSIGQILLGYFIVSAVQSLIFIFLLIGTHFSMGNDFPEPDAQGFLPGSWASHAVTTALDWSPHSAIANFFVGGANAHAAHHLYPGVSHIHYPWITKIIERECENYDILYKKTTFFGMVISHFRFLKLMTETKV